MLGQISKIWDIRLNKFVFVRICPQKMCLILLIVFLAKVWLYYNDTCANMGLANFLYLWGHIWCCDTCGYQEICLLILFVLPFRISPSQDVFDCWFAFMPGCVTQCTVNMGNTRFLFHGAICHVLLAIGIIKKSHITLPDALALWHDTTFRT